METNQNLNDEQTIDIGELFRELINKALIILLAALIGGLAGILMSKTVMTPEYTSTAKMYVLAQSSGDSVTNADLQAGASLTTDYEEIIRSRQVAETVIARLNLTNDDGKMMQYETLLKKISVSTPADSRVINISVSDEDPYIACDITDALLQASMEHIQDVMSIETISVVENANIPITPDSPNTMRNALMGAVLAAIIVIIIVIAVYMTNDTIRTSEDVERYLGLSTLGTIPLASTDKKNSKFRRRNVQAKGGKRR